MSYEKVDIKQQASLKKKLNKTKVLNAGNGQSIFKQQFRLD